MPWDGYPPMMGYYPFMGFWMILFWLIIIIVAAYLIYRLIKGDRILTPSRITERTAEDILAERYAKGELTREEYLKMREDIRVSSDKK